MSRASNDSKPGGAAEEEFEYEEDDGTNDQDVVDLSVRAAPPSSTDWPGGAPGAPPPSASDWPAGPPAAAAPAARPPPLDPAKLKHWVAVYPVYLCEELSTARGRRLPRAALAGCTGVTLDDLVQAFVALCRETGWTTKAIAEGLKRHPRAEWEQAGRLRVELWGEDGALAGAPPPGVTDRASFMRALAARIPALDSRKARIAAYEAHRAAWEEARRKAAGGKAAGAVKDKAGGGAGKTQRGRR